MYAYLIVLLFPRNYCLSESGGRLAVGELVAPAGMRMSQHQPRSAEHARWTNKCTTTKKELKEGISTDMHTCTDKDHCCTVRPYTFSYERMSCTTPHFSRSFPLLQVANRYLYRRILRTLLRTDERGLHENLLIILLLLFQCRAFSRGE